MQDILNQILQALLSVVLAALLLAGRYLWKRVDEWMTAKIGLEKWQEAKAHVYDAIQAAEQLYGAGAGDAKKAYVFNYLDALGIDATDTMVEAAVNSFYGKGKSGQSVVPKNETNADINPTGIIDVEGDPENDAQG